MTGLWTGGDHRSVDMSKKVLTGGCEYNGQLIEPGEIICDGNVQKQCRETDGGYALVPTGESCSSQGPLSVAHTLKIEHATDHGHMDMSTSKLFPKDVIAAAQMAQAQTGCLASVSLAQWAQESGFGKYQLHANNPFGMKWHKGSKYGYVSVLTKEWENGHYVTVPARFIAFPSIESAFLEHGKMLMDPQGPYKSAIQYKADWRRFIETIAPIYATDPNYALHLISIVLSFGLAQYDNAVQTMKQ